MTNSNFRLFFLILSSKGIFYITQAQAGFTGWKSASIFSSRMKTSLTSPHLMNLITISLSVWNSNDWWLLLCAFFSAFFQYSRASLSAHEVSKWIGWWNDDMREFEVGSSSHPSTPTGDRKWIRFPPTNIHTPGKNVFISENFHPLYLIVQQQWCEREAHVSRHEHIVAAFRQLWRWITNYLQLLSSSSSLQRVHMSLLSLNTLDDSKSSSTAVAAVVCRLLPRAL